MIPLWFAHHQAQLATIWESGRWPHAWLFAAPAGCGVEQFTHSIARALLCETASFQACGQCSQCRLIHRNQGSHPDWLMLAPEGNNQPAIKVEAVRRIREQLRQTPACAPRRVVVMAQAQCLTTAAANALLKLLEEPGEEVFFLLSTDHASQVLPTVTSRAQQCRLQADETAAHNWLLEADHDGCGEYSVADIWRLAGKRPLAARELMEQPGLLALRCQLIDALCAGTALTSVAASCAEAQLCWVLYWWFTIVADLIKIRTILSAGGGEPALIHADYQKALHQLARQVTRKALFDTYTQILALLRYQHQQVPLNQQLMVEKLVLMLSGVTDRGS